MVGDVKEGIQAPASWPDKMIFKVSLQIWDSKTWLLISFLGPSQAPFPVSQMMISFDYLTLVDGLIPLTGNWFLSQNKFYGLNHASKIIDQTLSSAGEFYYGECVEQFVLHSCFWASFSMPVEIHHFAVFPQVRFLSDGYIFAFYLLSTKFIQQAILDVIFFSLWNCLY